MPIPDVGGRWLFEPLHPQTSKRIGLFPPLTRLVFETMMSSRFGNSNGFDVERKILGACASGARQSGAEKRNAPSSTVPRCSSFWLRQIALEQGLADHQSLSNAVRRFGSMTWVSRKRQAMTHKDRHVCSRPRSGVAEAKRTPVRVGRRGDGLP